jgi:hypothetical protein
MELSEGDLFDDVGVDAGACGQGEGEETAAGCRPAATG